MNNITDRGNNECTGCAVCGIICPKNCITFHINEQGFYTPLLNEEDCTYCGLCKDVCYKYIKNEQIELYIPYQDKKVIAVLNNYLEQMRTVSTAGVATQLAKFYYKQGYNVCGVRFNPKTDKCEHIIIQNESDINLLKGSKYLQSSCFDAFLKLYNSKQKSIVFGTSCQIYGLRQLIKMKNIEDNFILVDLFCAGIPTFNLWKKYKIFLKHIFKIENINYVNFRDKTQGWHKFSIKIKDINNNIYRQNIFNDMFYSFFLKRTCLNFPCYNCQFRHSIVNSDIRLGDFWGNKYKMYDDGVEIVLLNTEKGEKAWENIQSSFRFEKCNPLDILNSQKIGFINLPKNYFEILESFSNDNEKLEEINDKYDINKINI